MTVVIHHFPEDAVDGDVLTVESVDVKPDSVRIEYAIYVPPARDFDAEKNFADAADALYRAVADEYRPEEIGAMTVYPSRLYLAMNAFDRARQVYGRRRV